MLIDKSERLALPRWAAELARALPALIVAGMLFHLMYSGATWSGVLIPDNIRTGLYLLAITAVGWIVWRTARNLPGFSTPLDAALPFWMISFALSTLANSDLFVRILIGLWFAGLYIVLWYILQDLLHHGLTGIGLTTALIVGGIPPLITSLDDLGQVDRIAGSMENPNILGAFLVLLIPVVFGRWLMLRWSGRAVLGAYLIAALVALYASGSRGGWLGMLAAMAFTAWALYGRHIRLTRVLILLAPVALIVGGLFFLARDNEGRINMAEVAINTFAAQPFTGSGLLTYRHREPSEAFRLHNHAHNLPLQIAAELGLPGLLALGVSLYLLGRAAWRCWVMASGAEYALRTGACAALIGFLVHHLTDFPVLTPAVAITLIVVLSIATAPRISDTLSEGQAVPPAPAGSPLIGRRWPLYALFALAILLVVAGLYNDANYRNLISIVINRGWP